MFKKGFLLCFIISLSSLSAETDSFYYSGGKKHFLNAKKELRSTLNKDMLFYKDQFGKDIGIDDQLIVSFKDISIKSEIESRYNLTMVERLTDNMYLYRVDNMDKTLSVSNKIYEESGVKFAHPNFHIKKIKKAISTDPYANLLWHLKDNSYYSNRADINIEEAWKYTKGYGIKLAVFDEGIDIDHVDLKDNIYKFANFNSKDQNTLPYTDDDKGHGTAVAGLVAASENRVGGVGVAPEVALYAVRYSNSNPAQDIKAYEWMMSEGVSVITNSWGTYKNLDSYNEIFKKLATEGRDGKGILIVFATGNKGISLDDDLISDESESEYVISIAASTKSNQIASYSNYGSSIDFTAPGGSQKLYGGLFTTDAEKIINGYVDGIYNYDFVGTSAAAPIAAGVMALMLSANSDLSREDIITILKLTSKKLGRYEYDESGYNIHWGYGKIDAGLAVKVARTYGKSNLKSFSRAIFQETVH